MINSNAALKFWLVFLLFFWLSGFTAVQSIFLGALAGWTGGLLSKWWSIKKVIDKDAKEDPLLRPVVQFAESLSNRNRRHKVPQHNNKPKMRAGWFGFFGPPKKRG